MTRIVLDDGCNTEINTEYSVGCIQNNFSGCGYCVVSDINDSENRRVYMITPKIIKYMVGDM